MADRLLVLVPPEHTHAPRSILEQARKLGPDVTEMRAIKQTMELMTHKKIGKWTFVHTDFRAVYGTLIYKGFKQHDTLLLENSDMNTIPSS